MFKQPYNPHANIFFANTEKILTLKHHHIGILENFQKAISTEAKLEVIKKAPVEDVVVIAEFDTPFATFCEQETLKEHWSQEWGNFGSKFVRNFRFNPPFVVSEKEKKSGDPEAKENNPIYFQLIRGVVFFYLSDQVRKVRSSDFTRTEMDLLKFALRYHSPHAIRRYNIFINQQLASPEATFVESKANYNILIENNKILIKLTQSYGYMAYAEALYHYRNWLIKNNGRQLTIDNLFQLIIESLKNAKNQAEISQNDIENISFGRGLRESNDLGFSSPEEAIKELTSGKYHQDKATFEALEANSHVPPLPC